MIHIKETEIIPLLKNAKAEYSQKITEGDPKDAEMAERIEEALTQAMDIVYDYQSMADEHKRMVEKYETEAPVINFAESREAWQRTTGDIKTGTHKTGTDDVECYDISDRRRVADKSEVSPTLTTKMGTGGNNVPIVLENHPQDSRVTIAEDGNVPTLTSRMGTGGAMCQ